MKTYIYIIFLIVICISLLTGCMGSFEINEADNIILISHYNDLQVSLSPDDKDFARILELCQGSMHKEIPGCPFGACEIQFITQEKTVSVFPVGDDCSGIAIGDISNVEIVLVSLSESDTNELKDILHKYGIETQGG